MTGAATGAAPLFSDLHPTAATVRAAIAPAAERIYYAFTPPFRRAAMSVQPSHPQKITVTKLAQMKAAGEKIVALTAYDYCSAVAAAQAGVEVLLVGDSLGMVIQGHDSSLPVTIEDTAYHVRCVRRARQGALLMADLPFMSYYSESRSLENAAILMREGAQMVKLEGGAWLAETTRLLVERGIPVCAHLGLMPQSVNHLGGYRVQGRDPAQGQSIIDEAKVLQTAGASLILIECVPASLGSRLSASLEVPVIGIGAGAGTDGQILVWHDLLGLYPGQSARFVKNYLKGNPGGVQGALANYVEDIKNGRFPTAEHGYS